MPARRALVTGAGQGVGLAVAGELAAAGIDVVVNDIDPDRAERAAARLRADGATAMALPFDVTSWQQTSEAARRGPAVDVLVNNAGNAGTEGFGQLVPFLETEPADWARFLAVNLYGVMHACRAFVPAMSAAGWGRVVTIISDAGRTGEPRLAAYSAAKAGAAGFSRALAREVAPGGVTVNCVSLGSIAPAAPAGQPTAGDERDRRARRYPVGRLGAPADVAGLVAFLASERAEWITGQTYSVNGGYAMLP
jgi:NAD(P)-dependent dehydrogenase (short-subunit alcohol dehydrogenase family)